MIVIKKEWIKKYKLAVLYFKEYGNLRVPSDFVTDDGVKLGRWIQTQRLAYKNRFIDGISNSFAPLSDKQVELLESIGMIWDLKCDNWLNNYKKVKAYYDRDKCLININDKKLKAWIETQRSAYLNRYVLKENRTNNLLPLTDEQVTLLESIGICFDDTDRISNNWMKNYYIAKKYYEMYGNLMPVKDYVLDDFNLGFWIRNQRICYKNMFLPMKEWKNKCIPLNSKQVFLLESIGMVWSIREYNFVNSPINKYKIITLNTRFLQFLDEYVIENKNEIESYDDVKNIMNAFMDTFGSEENHYKSFTKRKK